jgi:2',3'-cyclic-nucleotide 2'-phosphodiesterase
VEKEKGAREKGQERKMSIKALILGDVVGRPGREAVCAVAPRMRAERGIDIVIVNGENAAAGSGLTPKTLEQFFAGGVDVVTAGDHAYRNKEVETVIGTEKRLLRPMNYPKSAPGFGCGVFESRSGARFGAMVLIGRIFMDPADDPFVAADEALAKMAAQTKIIFVDVHAEATSEKIALGYHLDGRATCVFGTHTHVQTADAAVLPGGTAYITDLGMCGPHDGVLGRDKDAVLTHMRTNKPTRFEVSSGDVRVNGVVIEIDPETGKALSIERYMEKIAAVPQ